MKAPVSIGNPYAALESVGIRAKAVDAWHVRNVPGRKTNVGAAQRPATLTRAGLPRGSFVPPAKLRQLRLIARRLIARPRQKLVGRLALPARAAVTLGMISFTLKKQERAAGPAPPARAPPCRPLNGPAKYALPPRGA